MTGYESKRAAAQDKLAQPAQEPKVRTGDCLLVGVCASEGHKIQAQRPWVDLTRTQIQNVYFAVLEEHRGGHQMQGQLAFGEALQAAIKDKNK